MTDAKARIPAGFCRTRIFRDDPRAFFLLGFRRIARARMADIPACSPRLSVSAIPFRKAGGQWLGGLATPWSLMIIRACADPAGWTRIPEGREADVTLPGGAFRFTGVRDPELGEFQSCPLLSPVWEIPDQACAEAVLRLALEAMLSPRKASPESRGSMGRAARSGWPPPSGDES